MAVALKIKEMMMKNIKWLVLGYIMALTINGCDSVIANSDSDIEYGDYGTVSWKPLYVKIVE